MSATKSATAFRWQITDPTNPSWSRWHSLEGACSGCCCNGPTACPDCGGREHQEPAESISTMDAPHNTLCQSCREDIVGEVVATEEQL